MSLETTQMASDVRFEIPVSAFEEPASCFLLAWRKDVDVLLPLSCPLLEFGVSTAAK